MQSSRFVGFHRLSKDEKRRKLCEFTSKDIPFDEHITENELDRISENIVGEFTLPLSVAPNFRIDGEDMILPMCTEESSVVAACANGARMVYECGGFTTDACDPQTIQGMVQLVEIEDIDSAVGILSTARVVDQVLALANEGHTHTRATMVSNKAFADQNMIVVTLTALVGEAMGANAVNAMMEAIAPLLEDLAGARALCRILSNKAAGRGFTATCVLSSTVFPAGLLRDMYQAFVLATVSSQRAVTHNKGIMNGVIAVAQATGQDTRAIEAANHMLAAEGGVYSPLSTFELTTPANSLNRVELKCSIKLRCPVGTVGGLTTYHRAARAALDVLTAHVPAPRSTSVTLGKAMACAGLASNIAAIMALVGPGINRGHMALHRAKQEVSGGRDQGVTSTFQVR